MSPTPMAQGHRVSRLALLLLQLQRTGVVLDSPGEVSKFGTGQSSAARGENVRRPLLQVAVEGREGIRKAVQLQEGLAAQLVRHKQVRCGVQSLIERCQG